MQCSGTNTAHHALDCTSTGTTRTHQSPLTSLPSLIHPRSLTRPPHRTSARRRASMDPLCLEWPLFLLHQPVHPAPPSSIWTAGHFWHSLSHRFLPLTHARAAPSRSPPSESGATPLVSFPRRALSVGCPGRKLRCSVSLARQEKRPHPHCTGNAPPLLGLLPHPHVTSGPLHPVSSPRYHQNQEPHPCSHPHLLQPTKAPSLYLAMGKPN